MFVFRNCRLRICKQAFGVLRGLGRGYPGWHIEYSAFFAGQTGLVHHSQVYENLNALTSMYLDQPTNKRQVQRRWQRAQLRVDLRMLREEEELFVERC